MDAQRSGLMVTGEQNERTQNEVGLRDGMGITIIDVPLQPATIPETLYSPWGKVIGFNSDGHS